MILCQIFDIVSNYIYLMSNYMSNNLTSNHQMFDKIRYFFFQTATMWIFKGDFPFLHFLFCQKFENSHTKSGLVRSETLFWIINKICCFWKKGGMSRRQNGICFGTFFKKGSQVPFFGTLAVVGLRLVNISMRRLPETCRKRFGNRIFLTIAELAGDPWS